MSMNDVVWIKVVRDCAVFAVLGCMASVAVGDDYSNADFQLKVRGSYYLEGFSSTVDTASIDAATLLLQPKVNWRINKSWGVFALAEGFAASESVTLDEDFPTDRSEGYLALRELYVDYHGFSRYPKESIRFGSERIKEDTGLWWDREALTLRWHMDTTLVRSTFGVGKRVDFLRTDDSQLLERDKGRVVAFGSYEKQWRLNHWVGGKLFYSQDEDQEFRSGIAQYDRQYIWAGISANNTYYDEANLPWQYSIDLISLAGSAQRMQDENSAIDIDVASWAADLGIRGRLFSRVPLWWGAHYARASGGGDVDSDSTFYQNNLHTNRSRFANTRAKFSRFGEVARVDWSNVSIVTTYITHKVNPVFEWSFIAHSYQQIDSEGVVRIAGSVTQQEQSTVQDIGYELDLVFGYFSERRIGLWGNTSVQLRAGYLSLEEDRLVDLTNERYKVVFDIQKRF